MGWLTQPNPQARGATRLPMPLRELHERGAKVHGRTGDAVLGSLRALDLITYNTKNGVTLKGGNRNRQ